MQQTPDADIERPDVRRFGLADAMIFIIALGLGLALARPAIVLIADAIGSEPRYWFQTVAGAVSLARFLNIVLLNFLFFLLPAFLIVRLRRPRPNCASLFCQPGFTGCAAPVAIVLATMPLVWLPLPEGAEQIISVAVQILLVLAVPLVWVVLIATRRWNPEPSWIDRLGRTLAVLGIFCTPSHLVLIRLPY